MFDLHRHNIDNITIPSSRGPEFGVLRRIDDVPWHIFYVFINCIFFLSYMFFFHVAILKLIEGNISQVFDCWFESGSMPYAYIHYPFENTELFDNNFPGHFVAEGLDQTRGWLVPLSSV